MAGNQPALDTGFRILRKAGIYCMFGIPPDRVNLDINNYIIFKGATVKGINGRKMFETWYQMSALLSGGLVDPTPVITHRFAFAQFESAIKMWSTNSEPAGKIVLIME
jgi:threonine 3-dehydrogenase